jgi:hypothetical protein
VVQRCAFNCKLKEKKKFQRIGQQKHKTKPKGVLNAI